MLGSIWTRHHRLQESGLPRCLCFVYRYGVCCERRIPLICRLTTTAVTCLHMPSQLLPGCRHSEGGGALKRRRCTYVPNLISGWLFFAGSSSAESLFPAQSEDLRAQCLSERSVDAGVRTAGVSCVVGIGAGQAKFVEHYSHTVLSRYAGRWS